MEYLSQVFPPVKSLDETQLFFIITLASLSLTAFAVKTLGRVNNRKNKDSDEE